RVEMIGVPYATWKFRQRVCDIKALSVCVSSSRVVHRDESTGVETTHYMLEINQLTKKVSFSDAEPARAGKGGAFFEHVSRHYFFLALESGRHTDPEAGANDVG